MYRLREHWKKILFFFLFFLFLIVLQIRNPEIKGPFKGLVGNVANPFVYYSHKFYNGIYSIFSDYIFLLNVKEENKKLSEQVRRLTFENQILNEKINEYNRLKNLLSLKDTYQLNSKAARVVGKHIDGYNKYIIIDTGRDKGVKVNYSVANEYGLVGKVIEVFSKQSKVLLINDTNNKVSVMNLRTRVTGIMSGDGRGGLVVDFYDKLDKVYKDDIFVTSGLGGIYSKGIIVGRVYAYSNSTVDVFQKVYLHPSVQFSKIETVLVINNENEME
ncbi:MAG: rod shape-determining protein MreC [Calditerrivibrio sp.]|nr:rod shape-determining protein MreC [Calditerrivibrio sp.]MCA1981234.1 rod shape-determining protein MreC [Calditerrivibrio sp.]